MQGRIDPALIAEIRRRTSLLELIGGAVERLRPRRKGEYSALCPFHAEKTPSFYIVEDGRRGNGGFWHCFGCGAHGSAIDWVLKTRETDFRSAVEWLASRIGLRADAPPEPTRKTIAPKPASELRDAAAAKKIRLAREIWTAAQPVERSPAEAYLRGRGIRLPLPPTIRFHPGLAHDFLGRRRLFPACVSPFTIGGFNGIDRKIVAVEKTFLMPRSARADQWVKLPCPAGIEPRDWKPKITNGSPRGAAMRLTPAEDVMVLGEGRETCLSVLQALWDDEVGAAHIDGEPVGVWACGSISLIGAVELPPGVREVILLRDADGKIADAERAGDTDPEATLRAAAARHADQGRNVRIAHPPADADFNDLLPPGAGIEPEAAGLAA